MTNIDGNGARRQAPATPADPAVGPAKEPSVERRLEENASSQSADQEDESILAAPDAVHFPDRRKRGAPLSRQVVERELRRQLAERQHYFGQDYRASRMRELLFGPCDARERADDGEQEPLAASPWPAELAQISPRARRCIARWLRSSSRLDTAGAGIEVPSLTPPGEQPGLTNGEILGRLQNQTCFTRLGDALQFTIASTLGKRCGKTSIPNLLLHTLSLPGFEVLDRDDQVALLQVIRGFELGAHVDGERRALMEKRWDAVRDDLQSLVLGPELGSRAIDQQARALQGWLRARSVYSCVLDCPYGHTAIVVGVNPGPRLYLSYGLVPVKPLRTEIWSRIASPDPFVSGGWPKSGIFADAIYDYIDFRTTPRDAIRLLEHIENTFSINSMKPEKHPLANDTWRYLNFRRFSRQIRAMVAVIDSVEIIDSCKFKGGAKTPRDSAGL